MTLAFAQLLRLACLFLDVSQLFPVKSTWLAFPLKAQVGVDKISPPQTLMISPWWLQITPGGECMWEGTEVVPSDFGLCRCWDLDLAQWLRFPPPRSSPPTKVLDLAVGLVPHSFCAFWDACGLPAYQSHQRTNGISWNQTSMDINRVCSRQACWFHLIQILILINIIYIYTVLYTRTSR